MTIEEGLFDHLKNFAGLNALISQRIWPLVLPENPDYPAVVYQKISGPKVYSHSGASNLAYPLFQLSCWGESYADARAVATQVELALSGYKGAMGTVPVGASFVTNDHDMYDSEVEVCRVIIDVRIWHR